MFQVHTNINKTEKLETENRATIFNKGLKTFKNFSCLNLRNFIFVVKNVFNFCNYCLNATVKNAGYFLVICFYFSQQGRLINCECAFINDAF